VGSKHLDRPINAASVRQRHVLFDRIACLQVEHGRHRTLHKPFRYRTLSPRNLHLLVSVLTQQ
jgi:hypothetical protein